MNCVRSLFKYQAKSCVLFIINFGNLASKQKVQELARNKSNKLLKKPNESNRTVINRKLQELLNLKRIDVLKLTNKHKQLLKSNENDLMKNFHICQNNSLTQKSLIAYPEILIQKNLEEKINNLIKIPIPLKTSCCLLLLNDVTLWYFIDKYNLESLSYPGGRIRFMSELFNESQAFVCEKLVKMKFLQSIELEKLRNSYNLILSFGLSRDEINKDLWALKYKYNTINERLTCASKKSLGKIKLWMIRAKPEILHKYIERIQDNHEVLGNHSLIEYLSSKLECSTIQAKYLTTKLPAIENKSLKKMEEMLNFLYAKGFKPYHVYRVPKILLHSVNTVGKRLKELESQNIKLDSLYLLTKSQKQYQQYYDALIRSKKPKT